MWSEHGRIRVLTGEVSQARFGNQVLIAESQSASRAFPVTRARQAEVLQFSFDHATDFANRAVALLAVRSMTSIRSISDTHPIGPCPLPASNWLPRNRAWLAWVFVCCAIFSSDLAAQTPKAKRAPEKQSPTSDQTDEQKKRMSEPGQPTSTAQRAQALEEQKIKASELLPSPMGSPFPVKPPDASQPTSGNVLERREAAQQTLEALRLVIQSNPKSGMDLGVIKAREDELRTQLTTAKRDSEFNEVTAQAALLLAEITSQAPKSSIRPKAENDAANQAPSASRAGDLPGGKIPLVLSLISLAISVATLIASIFLTRSAITKALRSAGLQ